MTRLPSLKAVHYFATAARLQSFTAAADELNVTQGAVSRMVQALEEDLGVQLFTRNGRFITLTEAGRQYHHEVSAALRKIEVASNQLRQSHEGGALSVLVSAGFATRWLVPRLSQFQRLHPDIHVALLSSEEEERAQGTQAHLRIRYGSGDWAGAVSTRLPVPTTVGVVCSPKLLSQNSLEGPQELIGRPLLTYTGETRDLWREYFEHLHLPRPDLAQVSRFQQLLMLVEAAVSGLGFALVPLFLFEAELRSGRLVQALPHTFDPGRGYFIVHTKGADHDRKVQAFKKWILSQARQSASPPDSDTA